jgi:phosphoribosylaminoimidazole-succinocarboxamide synthase
VLDRTDLSRLLGPPQRGKVRDVYRLGDDRLVLVATDRLSAFDRVLGTVPHKGELLTALSAWWFGQLDGVVANHLLAVPDPNVTVALACRPLPVEVVVRGYLTGVTSTSLWPRYEAGERSLYGVELPSGLAFNDPLPTPIVTPTTKAAAGSHDEPLSGAEVVDRGLVEPARWAEVVDAALRLFAAGSTACAAAGMTLVDTKYEFGLDAEGRLRLIDEVHTPDSSRFWRAGTADNLDKELVRRHYVAAGYRGEGEPPPLPADLAGTLSAVYAEALERLTGRPFTPAAEPAGPRIEANLRRYLEAGG